MGPTLLPPIPHLGSSPHSGLSLSLSLSLSLCKDYQQSKFTFAQFVTVVSGCELPPAGLLPTPTPPPKFKRSSAQFAFPRAGAVDEEELNRPFQRNMHIISCLAIHGFGSCVLRMQYMHTETDNVVKSL
jgi:hypothetical protein